MQRRAILLPRQHLAESPEAHRPRAQLRQALLECPADPGRAQCRLPSRTPRGPLKSVAANEIGVSRRDVAESGHVNPVRPLADLPAVGPAVELPARPAP